MPILVREWYYHCYYNLQLFIGRIELFIEAYKRVRSYSLLCSSVTQLTVTASHWLNVVDRQGRPSPKTGTQTSPCLLDCDVGLTNIFLAGYCHFGPLVGWW